MMHLIDHLGIAVKSLKQARQFYEQLGLQVAEEETVEHEKVKVAMIPVGESRIELLEPTSSDSVIAKFLEKRGEGLHHVALHVPDLSLYVFVHPSSAGGVLLELCQDQPSAV
jgi:methylmalonyl-CoA epimerase